MIQENSSNKIKENKYKILRMSLLLGNGEDREETINNFEDASREIDAMNDEVYLKDLEDKFYDTLTLEEEEKKLSVLVDYIGGRVEQRISLLSDFKNVTGVELNNLPPIKYYEKLDEYKERLSYIREYLDNTKKINNLKNEISDLENKLNDTYVKKAKGEEKNIKEEAELLNRFNNIIRKNDYFKDVTLDNVNLKLEDATRLAEDSKKSLDIFNTSYLTLNNAGISEEEKKEYMSYVSSAKDAYYQNKEIEYLLRLYILFNSSESEYSKVITKRDTINDIIYERLDLRKQLEIKEIDSLNSIYDILENQYNNIKNQEENINNIEIYTNDINTRREEVSNLEKDNQKVEILSLLKEFCIIDTYEGYEDNITNEDNIKSTEEINIPTVGSIVTNGEKIPINSNIDNLLNNEPKQTIIDNIDSNNEPKEENIDNTIETTKDISNDNINTPQENNNITPSKEEPKEENIDITNAKDNQVVSVKEAKNININDAINKSNTVMKRVGEMLGVKIEETKIVSVDATKDDNTNNLPNNESSSLNVNNNPNFSVSPVNETSSIINNISPVGPIGDINKNDNNENNTSTKEINSEEINNILASNNFDADPENGATSDTVNPLFNNTLGNSTLDEVMANNKDNNNLDINNGDFWFNQEETPFDLNNLPDFNTDDNSFFSTNDNIPDLGFPDLNTSTEEEGK